LIQITKVDAWLESLILLFREEEAPRGEEEGQMIPSARELAI